MKKRVLGVVPLLVCLAGPVFGDSDELDCHTPENVKYKNMAKKRYQDMMAYHKAGKYRAAYDHAGFDAHCITRNEQEQQRLDDDRVAVLRQSSKKLGEEAENQGNFSVAYDYFVNFHGIDADRAQLKLASSKPGDRDTVAKGVYYFRNMQEVLQEASADAAEPADLDKARLNVMNRYISQESVDAMDPERQKRLQAVNDSLGKLEAIATRNGDAALAEEEQVFAARKTTLLAKNESLDELETARKWYELSGLEKRANERAVKRGDTLSADDGRNSLGLAIHYFGFARNEQKVRAVQEKARRLGDAHLQKGDKVVAAEYYSIAGLDDKALELNESHEAESAAAETKRKKKFDEEQKALEDELGL